MARQTDSVRIPLPHGWRGRVRSGMLHVMSLAQYALAYTFPSRKLYPGCFALEEPRLGNTVAWTKLTRATAFRRNRR